MAAANRQHRFLGMGKRSWLLIACLSFAILILFIYLENGRLEAESGGLSNLFTKYGGPERRRERINAELVKLGADRAWAGKYNCGDSLAFDSSLLIAPNAGYVLTGYDEYRGDFGGHWVNADREDGSFGVRDGVIYSHRSHEDFFHHGLRPVRWGRRYYLVPVGKLSDFAAAVNSGEEPRAHPGGNYCLRAGDEKFLTNGFPELPAETSAYLRPRPLDARITAIGADHEERTDWGSGFFSVDHATTISLDVGRRQGALAGMKLGDGKATIIKANENTSVAIYIRSEYSSGGSSPGVQSTPPARGQILSTRTGFFRGFSPLDEPLETAGKPFSRAYPPLPPDAATTAGTRAYFESARRQGFSVVPVAHVRMSAVTRDAFDSGEARDKWSALLHGLGGNAYVTTSKSEKARAPRRFSEEADVYRIEWKGRPLGDEGFSSSDRTNGWMRARRRLSFEDLPFTQAMRKIRRDAIMALLHLSEDEYHSYGKLRVENLRPDQRAAFASLRGLNTPFGLLRDAAGNSPAFGEALDAAIAPQIASLQSQDPSGYAEYRRLEVALKP